MEKWEIWNSSKFLSLLAARQSTRSRIFDTQNSTSISSNISIWTHQFIRCRSGYSWQPETQPTQLHRASEAFLSWSKIHITIYRIARDFTIQSIFSIYLLFSPLIRLASSKLLTSHQRHQHAEHIQTFQSASNDLHVYCCMFKLSWVMMLWCYYIEYMRPDTLHRQEKEETKHTRENIDG